MKEITTPSPAGLTGRGPGGRFAPGNKAGQGNPLNKQTQQIRAMLLRKLSAKKVEEVADVLIRLAKGGNLAAIREVFDRTIGKASESQLMERVEALENQISERKSK